MSTHDRCTGRYIHTYMAASSTSHRQQWVKWQEAVRLMNVQTSQESLYIVDSPLESPAQQTV